MEIDYELEWAAINRAENLLMREDAKNTTKEFQWRSTQKRKCMSCTKQFDSHNKFHRICDKCKKSENYLNEYEYEEEYPVRFKY